MGPCDSLSALSRVNDQVVVMSDMLASVLRRYTFCQTTVAMKFSSPNTSSMTIRRLSTSVVVDTDEYHSISSEQISRKLKPWIHHVEPVSVEAAGGFGVGGNLAGRLPSTWPVSSR